MDINNKSRCIERLINHLEAERSSLMHLGNYANKKDRRQYLRDLQITREGSAKPLPTDLAEAFEKLLSSERIPSKLPEPKYFGRISVWKGDITTLPSDVIVNAANPERLGCFRPEHRCVDNVIHAAAGPRLREQCFQRMNSNDPPHVLVTDAYALPSKYIMHVAGPVSKGDEELASCYQDCLDAMPTGTTTISFPCISTGLYGFPREAAAQIAITTVLKYLREHPNPPHVIFNTFQQEDYDLYQRELKKLEAARKVIQEADIVLLGGAAGLSASAGLDYTDRKLFAKLFPQMLPYMSCMYDALGPVPWTPNKRWAYIAEQVLMARFNWPQHEVYEKLLRLCETKEDYFVLTTNVDGMFHRNGFEPSKVFMIQGDYGRAQCLSGCGNQWDAKPMLEHLRSVTTPEYEVPDEHLPVCSRCGSNKVFLNVRGGDWFLENHPDYISQQKNFAAFMRRLSEAAKTRKIVILEIGAGYNTPGIIRLRNENIVQSLPNTTLVRVNAHHPESHLRLDKSRYHGLSMDALEAVRILSA